MVSVYISSKVDLDTVGVGYLFSLLAKSFSPEEIEVVRGEAPQEVLADPSILCVEVGGSGRVSEGCFDHHGPGSEGLRSATKQAYEFLQEAILPKGRILLGIENPLVSKLVDYIDKLDIEGPKGLGEPPGFPTLSDLFSGLLLTTRDPKEQFLKGIGLLKAVVEGKVDPFGIIPKDLTPETAAWAEAKTNHNRLVAEAIKKAKWETTQSGLKLAYLETSFVGAPGALYEAGAQVVVVFNPAFGPAKVRKFTVAGNGIKVNSLLPALNNLETGWGGPGHGTILGSPREGSKLSLEEVVQIVKTL